MIIELMACTYHPSSSGQPSSSLLFSGDRGVWLSCKRLEGSIQLLTTLLNPAIAVSLAASTKLSKALDIGKPGTKQDNVVYATISCSKATTAICMKKRSIMLVVVWHNSFIFVCFCKISSIVSSRIKINVLLLLQQQLEVAGNSQIYFNHEGEKPGWGWSWLEQWMAAQPWENQLVDSDMGLKEVRTPVHQATATQSVQSFVEELPLQELTTKVAAGANNDLAQYTSPITSTLIQLQRQQQQMLGGHADEQSDSSSTPHSETLLSNSDNAQPASQRRYMVATKLAKARLKPQSTTPKQVQPVDDDNHPPARKHLSSSLPTQEVQEHRSMIGGGVSVSPKAFQGTASVNAPGSRSQRLSHKSAFKQQMQYAAERASSKNTDYLTTSSNSERPVSSHKATEFLMATSYNSEQNARKPERTSFLHSSSSYNNSHDQRQLHKDDDHPQHHQDFLTTSYSYERPPRKSEKDSYQQSRRSAEHATTSHNNSDIRSSSKLNNKADGDYLQQSYDMERWQSSERPSSSSYKSASHTSTRSNRSASAATRSKASGDYLHRSYQSDRQSIQGRDSTSSLPSASYADFRKPFR
jgi:hypothetical protein